MKTCVKCNEEKALDCFSWRNKAKELKMSWCKTCVKAYDTIRQSTEEYKKQKAFARNRRRQINRSVAVMHLMNFPCIDCGNKDVRVLDFDHRDGVDKVANIAEMLENVSMKTLLAEIAKCDVRCANCHRIRTGEQFGYWRSVNYNAFKVE